jgi:hypothetical protein
MKSSLAMLVNINKRAAYKRAGICSETSVRVMHDE